MAHIVLTGAMDHVLLDIHMQVWCCTKIWYFGSDVKLNYFQCLICFLKTAVDGPGKKLGDVGDVGERNLRRFLTLTFLPGSIRSTKKVGDISSPIFPSSDFFTWPHVFY